MSHVLFFGGEKMTLALVVKSVNGTHLKKAFESRPYSGIVNGEFVNRDEIPTIFSYLVRAVPRGSVLTVGVPSCFVKVSVATAEKKYERPSKVSVRDAENLAGGGNVVYFTIDGGKPILNAVGFKAEKIVEAQVATTTFAVEFTSVIKKCLAAAPSFRHVNFIPIAKAEANYLIDSAVRDGTCVLISSKMFSTSAAVVSGDEICAIETFDMGTAHIENDISLVLNVGYHKAHEMFANYKGAHDNLDAIVRARVDDIGEQITAAISKMGKGLLEFPFFICGGYLDLVPGAVETLEKNLNVKIGTLGCPFNEVNLPDVVSNDAVISMSF